MESQPRLDNNKEIIAFLVERFPQCFSIEDEARLPKIGIFRDPVERVGGEMNLSRIQLRATLRLYTSSWRYLYGAKVGAICVDLNGNSYDELEGQHIAHVRQQPEEAKTHAQVQCAAQQAKKCEATAAAGQQDEGVCRKCKSRPQQPRYKRDAERRKPRPAAAKAPHEERHTPVPDTSALTVGQALKVKAGNNAMDATVLEITKNGVHA